MGCVLPGNTPVTAWRVAGDLMPQPHASHDFTNSHLCLRCNEKITSLGAMLRCEPDDMNAANEPEPQLHGDPWDVYPSDYNA